MRRWGSKLQRLTELSRLCPDGAPGRIVPPAGLEPASAVRRLHSRSWCPRWRLEQSSADSCGSGRVCRWPNPDGASLRVRSRRAPGRVRTDQITETSQSANSLAVWPTRTTNPTAVMQQARPSLGVMATHVEGTFQVLRVAAPDVASIDALSSRLATITSVTRRPVAVPGSLGSVRGVFESLDIPALATMGGAVAHQVASVIQTWITANGSRSVEIQRSDGSRVKVQGPDADLATTLAALGGSEAAASPGVTASDGSEAEPQS